MFSVGVFRIRIPLIWAIKLFNEPFWEESFQISHKDDVVLAMKVDPTIIAMMGIVALCLTGFPAIENLIERLLMDIA